MIKMGHFLLLFLTQISES